MQLIYFTDFQKVPNKRILIIKNKKSKTGSFFTKYFNVLQIGRVMGPFVNQTDNFVANQSPEIFTEQQSKFLNNEPNLVVQNQANIPLLIPNIRGENQCILYDITNHSRKEKEDTNKDRTSYIEVDKGNILIILDKEDYQNRMKDKLENGAYRDS